MSDADDLRRIRPISSAMDVPVFNVVIYLAHRETRIEARVANLPDLEFSGATEPAVLKQAITEVKTRLSRWHSAGEAIPWIDPIPAPDDGEQERLVPVHL